jgi:PleD family two-component response regulator
MSQRIASAVRRSGRTSTGTWYVAREQLDAIAIPDETDLRRQDGESALRDIPPEDIDELTGLPIRRRFEQTMIVALEQARAADTPLSMAIFDACDCIDS